MSLTPSKEHGVNPTIPLCFYCQSESTNEVLLLGANRGKKAPAPGTRVFSLDPCETCKALMDKGVILISVRDGEPDKVDRAHSEYKDEVTRLSPFQRKRVWPFIPNPYRTGGWCVLIDEAVRRMVAPDPAGVMLRCRWGFVEDAAWDALGLPRGEVEGVPSDPKEVTG